MEDPALYRNKVRPVRGEEEKKVDPRSHTTLTRTGTNKSKAGGKRKALGKGDE